ncbi:MAG: hypothetical protein JWN18_18 [Parcubacteria group bacterium]|nr:hypothetical protein [Parcubacteria group bacterium]
MEKNVQFVTGMKETLLHSEYQSKLIILMVMLKITALQMSGYVVRIAMLSLLHFAI